MAGGATSGAKRCASRRARGAAARAPRAVSRTTSSSPATARRRGGWCACCTARASPTSSRRSARRARTRPRPTGCPVLRGDCQPPAHAACSPASSAPRCWWSPTTTRPWRIASPRWRARSNPTMRIVVRTRYIAEIEPLAAAGADRVIAEELESVVQLFADVMRSYDLAAEEIERQRGGRSAAAATRRCAARSRRRAPVVECALGPDCLDRAHGDGPRRRAGGGPEPGRAAAREPIRHQRRGGAARQRALDAPIRARSCEPGDELVLAGTADAFAQAAPLFRVGTLRTAIAPRSRPPADTRTWSTPSGRSSSRPAPDAPLRAPRPDPAPCIPSARGCEDCLRIGDRWVHLRICMTLRPRRLLRLVAEQARHRAPPHRRHPIIEVARAGRGLGLVLSGRGDVVAPVRGRSGGSTSPPCGGGSR